MKTVSILIPAYNEEKYIGGVLQRVMAIDTSAEGFEKEIIVINDGSTDGTANIAASFRGVKVLNKINGGKGSAVQMGLRAAGGEAILVQDADLEYFPEDYPALLRAFNSSGPPAAVYGSRFLGQLKLRPGFTLFPGKHPRQGIGPWFCNIILGLECLLLYGRFITDNLTAYKLYPAEVLKKYRFTTSGFEGDHEITALLIRKGYAIKEIPIAYEPRSLLEGKKIRAVDGLTALWTFLRCRFLKLDKP